MSTSFIFNGTIKLWEQLLKKAGTSLKLIIPLKLYSPVFFAMLHHIPHALFFFPVIAQVLSQPGIKTYIQSIGWRKVGTEKGRRIFRYSELFSGTASFT